MDEVQHIFGWICVSPAVENEEPAISLHQFHLILYLIVLEYVAHILHLIYMYM